LNQAEWQRVKTDKQTFRIFQAYPPWVFELTGLPSPGKSTFLSIGLKALERRADGVIMPDDPAQAITVVEFQFQMDAGVYTRIAAEMALLQEANAWRDIQGVIIFQDRSVDPKTSPWNRWIHVFYLNDLLAQLEQRNPHHPLVAVFKPLVVEDEVTLAEMAKEYYRDINTSSLDESSRTAMADVFLNWLLQRFKQMTRKEIEMLIISELPDLEDTTAGKELIRIGEKRGEKRGEQRGKKEGKKEGKQLGKQEGVVEAILIFLQARHGRLRTALRERVQALDLEHAKQLLPLIAKWETLEPLYEWLDQNSAKRRSDNR